MMPDKWIEYNTQEDAEVNVITVGESVSFTTLYTCGKCGKNKASVYYKQVRSCDEGVTAFLTCFNPSCRKKWSVNC